MLALYPLYFQRICWIDSAKHQVFILLSFHNHGSNSVYLSNTRNLLRGPKHFTARLTATSLKLQKASRHYHFWHVCRQQGVQLFQEINVLRLPVLDFAVTHQYLCLLPESRGQHHVALISHHQQYQQRTVQNHEYHYSK